MAKPLLDIAFVAVNLVFPFGPLHALTQQMLIQTNTHYTTTGPVQFAQQGYYKATTILLNSPSAALQLVNQMIDRH